MRAGVVKFTIPTYNKNIIIIYKNQDMNLYMNMN